MVERGITYMITSMLPLELDEKVAIAKQQFNLYKAQEKSDPQHVILMNEAHLTLKRWFNLREGINEQKIVDALNGIPLNPIPIYAGELDVFHSFRVSNVIVAVVEKTPALQHLHMEIFERLLPYINTPESFEKERFTPHISLMYQVPDGVIEQAKQYAQQYLLPIQYTVDSFCLLKNIPKIPRERKVIKRYTATSIQI